MNTIHSGTIFPRLTSNASKSVGMIFKQILNWAGIRLENVAGKSARRGGATILAQQGVSLPMIMKAGRWKSVTALDYIHEHVLTASKVDTILFNAAPLHM